MKTWILIAILAIGSPAYAQLGGMPMMMITGQKPIKSSKQGRFQILDVVDMMRPITKFTHQMASADNIPSRVREAFRLAQEEKPGAAHIEFPEDIADEDTDSTPLQASLSRRPAADAKAVRAAVKKIESAKSPLLVIGAYSCLRDGWSQLFQEIARGSMADRIRKFVERNRWFFNWYTVAGMSANWVDWSETTKGVPE